MMIKKKICMLGSFAVGKTSLVRQFVHSIFSSKYHTTIGVKIDQKSLAIDDQDVLLMLWDIHGQDDFQEVKPSYLMGASGYFLVVDGTRADTLTVALSLRQMVLETVGDIPFILLLNKSDLPDQWEIEEEELKRLKESSWRVLETSAKTGAGVEEAFTGLARQMLEETREREP
jgi:small GTP-binding protein